MISTVEAVCDRARVLLSDTQVAGGEVFTNTLLIPLFSIPYENLFSKMENEGLPLPKHVAQYVLPANTTSLSPATASITNFGELEADGLQERLNGSAEQYLPLDEVTDLNPNITATDRLRFFEWAGDQFLFVGATTDRQLRIIYWASGSAPTTGSVGVDNAQNYLAAHLAALAGQIKDRVTDADRLSVMALGPNRDGNGGFLFDLLNPMLKAGQRVTSLRPAFRARGRYRRNTYGY